MKCCAAWFRRPAAQPLETRTSRAFDANHAAALRRSDEDRRQFEDYLGSLRREIGARPSATDLTKQWR
jgi:hypothetical protein